MKTWKILLITFGLTPWPFIISLSAFFFHAGNILNYSPSYGNPDPKELAIYSDYSLFINTSALTWIYSFLVWLLLIILYLIMNRKNIRWKTIGFGAIGHFFAICLLFSGVFEWYID
ncbi:hypothetical protein D3C87_25920 [compost metagenome]